MSQAASQASAFYREVAETRVLWTVEDDVGYPAPVTSSGQRAQPFWSSRSRAERIIANAPAYRVFRPAEVAWADFCARWVPDFIRDSMLVGVNWSGPRVTGYDVEPGRVQEYVQTMIDRAAAQRPGV